ncbi:ABC transporter ATP-binding protein [Schleiferilactobacillus harbinensis]|uniref:ABC transporter ATP-binding protein n=1 Tax=Schleiferilactobacillus harbinensis TaxID=304207 RepID=UPI0039E95570
MTTVLSVENLTKQYGTFTAVNGVSFSLAAGRTLAILGPNGAGKSTTLKMIYATTPITRGTVMINGINVQQQPRLAKQTIGVVMQDDLLDTTLTVLENMIAHGILFDTPLQAVRSRAHALLTFVGLANYENADTTDLSGGMRRRLVLARPLINDPQLIILDEPTTGLDIQSRHVFWRKLNILKQQGAAILLTSHYVDEIAALADDVVIVDHGCIVAAGPADTLAQQLGAANLEQAYLQATHFDERSDQIEQTRHQ